MQSPDALDRFMLRDVRIDIEERFWRPIEAITSLEAMVSDEAFFVNPGRHIGLYADHGPTHARDVALRVLEIARWAFGSLVEDRAAHRCDFVSGAAVVIALIHDVGMCVVPPVGRELHAQYAAQLVFSDLFADVIDVVDAVRLVREADALRQRGTTFRTSVDFEVVVDARTRGAELRGDAPRLDFHRGSFESESVFDRVVDATVAVIDDVQRDVLPTFPESSIALELAEPQDEPRFAHRVAERILELRPELAEAVVVTPVVAWPGGTFLECWSDPFTGSVLRGRLARTPLR